MGLAAIGATSTGQWFTQEVGGFDRSPALAGETAFTASAALAAAIDEAGVARPQSTGTVGAQSGGIEETARPATSAAVGDGGKRSLAAIGRVAVAVAKASVARPQSTGAARTQRGSVGESTRPATSAAVGDGGKRSLAAVGRVAIAVAEAGVASPQSTRTVGAQSGGIGETARPATRPAVGNCIDGCFTAIGGIVVTIFETSRAALTLIVYTACATSTGRTDTTIRVTY